MGSYNNGEYMSSYDNSGGYGNTMSGSNEYADRRFSTSLPEDVMGGRSENLAGSHHVFSATDVYSTQQPPIQQQFDPFDQPPQPPTQSNMAIHADVKKQSRPTHMRKASTGSNMASETVSRDPRRIVVILVASFLETIAAVYACESSDTVSCDKEYGFAVALGVISMALVMAYIVYLKLFEEPRVQITQALAGFLLIWWVVGVIICTFRKPFKVAGNGYFSTWVAAAEATYFAFSVVPALEQQLLQMQKRAAQSREQLILTVMICAGMIELAAAADVCTEKDDCSNEYGFAVAVGVIATVVATASLAAPNTLQEYKPILSLVLGIFMFPATWVFTFHKPFKEISNGFFSTWCLFVTAWVWTYVTYFEFLEDNGIDMTAKWLKRADSIIREGSLREP